MSSGKMNILVGVDFSDTAAVAMLPRAGAGRANFSGTPPGQRGVGRHLDPLTDVGMNAPFDMPEIKERTRMERMRAMIGGKVDVELHLRRRDSSDDASADKGTQAGPGGGRRQPWTRRGAAAPARSVSAALTQRSPCRCWSFRRRVGTSKGKKRNHADRARR